MTPESPVPLPFGTELTRNTVLANPILNISGDGITVHESTDSGWPTVITMESDDHAVGIAIDYLGSWHGQNVGMEEVDLILLYRDGQWMWRAVVAFGTKDDAIERGRYEIDEYDGYELVPWGTTDRYERIEALIEEGVTPIAYTEDQPSYPAHAMQDASDIDTLQKLFPLDGLETLSDRRESVFRRVVPREVRWDGRETELQRIARSVESDDDSS